MAARAEIKASISMDGRALKFGLAQASQEAISFASKMKHIGASIGLAFGARQVLGFTANLARASHELEHAAERAGVAAGIYQALEAAIQLSGGEAGDAAMMLSKLKNAQGDVIANTKGSAAKAFADLGFSLKEVAESTTPELLVKIGRALNRTNNAASEYRATMDLIGLRSGPRMLLALNEIGRIGIEGLMEQQKKLIQSDETIAYMAELTNKAERANKSFKTWATEGLAQVAKETESGIKSLNDLGRILGTLSEVGLKEFLRMRRSGELARDLGWGTQPPSQKIDTDAIEKEAKQKALAETIAREKAEEEKRTKDKAVGFDSLREIGAGGDMFGMTGELRETNRLLQQQIDLMREQLNKAGQTHNVLRSGGLQ